MREPNDTKVEAELDERRLRELFPLDHGAGPAPRRSAAQLDQLLDAALDAFEGPAPTPEPPVTTSGTTGASAAGIQRLALATTAAVVLVGAAALLLRPALAPDVAESLPAPSAPAPGPQTPPAAVREADTGAARTPAARRAGASDADGTGDDAPATQPEGSPPQDARDDAPEDAPEDGLDEAQAAAADATPRPGTPARSTGETSDPRDLLREANALRGQAQFAAAERLYVRVAREHPGSSSAYVAKVAAASLRLERLGNARGALSLYRAALRESPSGSLVQEVRRGIALSHRRLGVRTAEAQALREFVAHHPGAPFANAARARLAELEAGSTDDAADQPE